MTIEEDGFLSTDAATWIGVHRKNNGDAFELAERLSRVGQKLMLSTQLTMPGGVLDARGLALLLFVRVLSNFQGMILLAERGLVVEARTLARSCLESTFALVAGVKQQDAFVPKMVSHALDARTKAANSMLERARNSDLISDKSQAKLRKYVDEVKAEGEALAAFATIDMARRSGLEDFYIFYRALSGDAAHPTLDALNRYVDNGDADIGTVIAWGPKCGEGEITETLMMACSFVIASITALNELSCNPEVSEEISEAFETFKALSERFGIAQAECASGVGSQQP